MMPLRGLCSGLLKQRAFERLRLIPRQGRWGPDGLPEVAEFVKQAALMRDVGIHQPERRYQAGAAIMDEEFNAPLAIDPAQFERRQQTLPGRLALILG